MWVWELGVRLQFSPGIDLIPFYPQRVCKSLCSSSHSSYFSFLLYFACVNLLIPVYRVPVLFLTQATQRTHWQNLLSSSSRSIFSGVAPRFQNGSHCSADLPPCRPWLGKRHVQGADGRGAAACLVCGAILHTQVQESVLIGSAALSGVDTTDMCKKDCCGQ